ncbi:MAG TPA: pantoate--beta-alanine ligase [Ktedonobacterales bacterium]|nr:pantoate--beta-alanine ligase [Ktedonobacterales bacterium]
MRVIETVDEMRAARRGWGERRVGLVPTMGFLHAGHISLVERARAENDVVVVSIFVNPAQFAPNEDLARYPRDLPRDLAMLESAGTDIVFTPAVEQIYPPGYNTYVEPSGVLAERLESATRPSHFRGVATVVTKLLQIIAPDTAYFGQKDAQQVAVVRRLVADLNLPVSVRVQPIVRESDGLAMSSRNKYLGPEDRTAAAVLNRALQAGADAFERQPAEGVAGVIAAMKAVVAGEPRIQLDYADVCDPDTFAPLTELHPPALLAIAAKVGPARLIDNFLLRADGTWDKGVSVAP